MSERWLNNNNLTKPTLDEFIADAGCSMVARVSNPDGQCSIRNEPCPPACLLRQIASLKSQRDTDNEISRWWERI